MLWSWRSSWNWAERKPANTNTGRNSRRPTRSRITRGVLWRRQPYQGELISIDENGVRRTLHTRCDDKALTIWMFGDSVMWGAGAPDTDTIPTLVAADYEKAGRPACIVNYAEKGWSSTQEMIGLMEESNIPAASPISCSSTMRHGGVHRSPEPPSDVHSNFASFKNFWTNERGAESAFFLLEPDNTYHLLDKISPRVFSPQASGKRGPGRSHVDGGRRGAQLRSNMEIINALGKQFGFRAIFAWYPNMAVGTKYSRPTSSRCWP